MPKKEQIVSCKKATKENLNIIQTAILFYCGWEQVKRFVKND